MKGRETRDWDMSTSAIEWTRGAGELSGLGFAAFQRGLTAYNSSRMRPGLPEESPSGELDLEHVVAQAEVIFIETQRRAIAPFVADIPSGTDAFMAWYEGLKQTGPGQGDPLFPWLASSASVDQMKWFLFQEVAGEAGFDDLLAMTQVKMRFRQSSKWRGISGTKWAAVARRRCTVRCLSGSQAILTSRQRLRPSSRNLSRLATP
jgi:hypothetical protein